MAHSAKATTTRTSRGIAIGLVPGLLAAGLAAVAAVVAAVGPLAAPANAASLTPGRLCSGAQVAGSFFTPNDSAPFKLYVPSGATVTVSGSADIVANDTTGGWQTILTIDPVGGGMLGHFYGGPYYNQPFNYGPWTNGGASGDITVNVRQQYGTHVNWRFTATVSSGGGTGACTPMAPRETLGQNCAEKHATASQPLLADPVNTATGNFEEAFADLVVPGRGPALAFDHSYNSLAAGDDGALGFGWTDAYAMSLAVNSTSGVATVRQEGGAEVYLYPDGSGGFEAPARAVATLVHNADGTYTFTRCNQTTLGFSSTGQLTSITDRNGYATTLQYAAGKLSTVTDSASRQLHVTWTGSHITSVSDSSSPARTVSFAYNDGAGNLTDYTDAGASAWHFTYDAGHHLTTIRRPRQAGVPNPPVTTNVYDASGRVTSQADELNRTTLFDYTSIPSATKVTDPKGNVTVETYQGLVRTALTKGYGTPGAQTWNITSDPYTLGITQVSDPNGHATTAVYDRDGNVVSQTDAMGHTTTATYNNFDEPLTSTDPNGVTTTYTYDANGNPKTRSTPLLDAGGNTVATRTTTYGYDPAHAGDLTTLTDPLNKVWTQSFDSFGDLASTADPLGNKTLFGYDTTKGWLTAQVAPRGVAAGVTTACVPAALDCTTFAHDAWGHVSVTTDANGHQITSHYDADGHLDYAIDADNNRTNYVYDAADEPTTVQRADTTTLKTDYWPDGSVKDTVDGANHMTSYGYDALGRMTSMTDPDNRTTTYGYDAAGNPTTKADPGTTCPGAGCTTMAYDAANRLTSVSYGDGHTPNVSLITYDNDGRRTAMADGTGNNTWSWDSLGRLTASADGAGHALAYGYANLRDPATAITYSPGHVVARVFDAAGRMSTESDWLSNTTTFSPDADSNPGTVTFPTATGLSDTFGVDNAGQLTSVTDKAGAATVTQLTYTRDGADQLKSVAGTGVPADTHSYTYTPLNQVKNDGAATNYGYDAADNLTSMPSGATLGYDAANQATSETLPTGSAALAYDTRGNRTSVTPAAGVGTTLTYDQANRLTSVDASAFPTAISAGYYFSLGVKADGTVWAWGSDAYGQLGNNSTTDVSVPVQVQGLTGVVAVAAGAYQSTALRSDGTVWAWGSNSVGQLGNNSTVDSHVPVQVQGLSGVVAIAAGASHTLALRSDGTVWAWGYNSNGQLGNNSIVDAHVPVQVQGLSGVTAVAGGYTSATALRADGTVWAWGYNGYGQLGNNTVTDAHLPVQVQGLSGVSAIAAGWFHMLALRSDGTVWAWGYNAVGQLGNNTLADAHLAFQVPGISGVASIAASTYQSFAQKTDTTLWSWGWNAYAQLGNGTTADSHVPTATGLSGLKGLAPAPNNTLALRGDGTVVGWGWNGVGNLGNGTTIDARTPATVVTSAPKSYSATVAGGWFHSLAVKNDGTVWAWGYNGYGQLGNNSTTDSSVPLQVPGLAGVVAVAAGAYNSVALKSDGTVWAWGNNADGQLGNNSTTDSHVPVQVQGLSGITAIAAGTSHLLALRSDGTVWAWGYNSNGQVGNNTTVNALVPAQVQGLSGAVGIAGGYTHSVAVRSDGTVWAWGYNGYGQLGNNTVTDAHTATQVPGLAGVASVSAGFFHTLALKADGTVSAWGYNAYGELGNNSITDSHVPVAVPGLTTVATIAAGSYHSYVLNHDGTVWDFGLNNYGQLGNGTTTDSHVPIAIGVANATGLAAGYIHVLVPRADNTLTAWGYNAYGGVGNGTTVDAHSPVTVSGFNRGGSFFNRGTSPKATYAYNGDGLRTSKTVAGITSSFTWDTNASLPLVLDDGTNSYIYGPDGLPLEQIDRSGVVTWFHHDQLGSTRTLTNTAGAVVGSATYDAYGHLNGSTGTLSPFGFSGQYTDAETGFQYLRARYYDPATAQFITVDHAYPQSGSRYGYVNGSPLNGTDPSGMCWPKCMQGVADFAAGTLNVISFGHEQQITRALGVADHVNRCSGAYKFGEVAGVVMMTFLVPGGAEEAGAEGLAAETEGSGAETFYRTMSKGDFADLQATGRVPATSETFISPSSEFASGYEGTTVQFSVQPGTTDALANVGVRDSSNLVAGAYPDMPVVQPGWTSSSAFFKGEGDVTNIGLGRGTALDIFNNAILGFGEVP